MLVAITVSLHFQKLSTAHCFTLYTSLSSWPKLNQNISEPSWLSLCSPLQQATDSISAPSRLMGRQAERGANALITACHMMGLAWVLSNKALMSCFNCLHGIPCQALPELLTHTHRYYSTGLWRIFVPSEMASKWYRICIHHWSTKKDHYCCHSNALVWQRKWVWRRL